MLIFLKLDIIKKLERQIGEWPIGRANQIIPLQTGRTLDKIAGLSGEFSGTLLP
jgi:hypothetical protein